MEMQEFMREFDRMCWVLQTKTRMPYGELEFEDISEANSIT